MNPRIFSPLFFFGALACFLMPFFNVSCQNQEGKHEELATMTGLQMVMGAKGEDMKPKNIPHHAEPTTQGGLKVEPVASETGEDPGSKDLKPMPLAIADASLIALAALVGLGAFKSKPGLGIIGALALAVHVALWIYMSQYWLKSVLKPSGEESNELAQGFGEMMAAGFTVSPQVGYFLVLASCTLGTVMMCIPVRKTQNV